jgi:hypothetical protein
VSAGQKVLDVIKGYTEKIILEESVPIVLSSAFKILFQTAVAL